MKPVLPSIVVLTAIMLSGIAPVSAGDWPTFLGPSSDGVSPEKGIIKPWPAAGLKKLWECELGIGFAPPVAAGGKLFHADRFGDNIRLTCRDAGTGKPLEVRVPHRIRGPLRLRPRPAGLPGGRWRPRLPLRPRRRAVLRQQGHRQGNLEGRYEGEVLLPPELLRRAAACRSIDGDLLILPVGGSAKGPRPIDFREVKPNGTASSPSTRRPAR